MASVSSDLITIPRRKEPLNLLTGVFLKSIFFLDSDLTKCVVTGIFKNRDNSLGILFKGRKGCVFWSYSVLNQISVHFNDVTLAVEGKGQLTVKADCGEGDIRVNQVFGHQYTYISDGEHSLALNATEWHMLVNNLVLIYNSLKELFYFEDLIKESVDHFLSDNEDYYCDKLPSLIAQQLHLEVQLYKRWPNGGSG